MVVWVEDVEQPGERQDPQWGAGGFDDAQLGVAVGGDAVGGE